MVNDSILLKVVGSNYFIKEDIEEDNFNTRQEQVVASAFTEVLGAATNMVKDIKEEVGIILNKEVDIIEDYLEGSIVPEKRSVFLNCCIIDYKDLELILEKIIFFNIIKEDSIIEGNYFNIKVVFKMKEVDTDVNMAEEQKKVDVIVH